MNTPKLYSRGRFVEAFWNIVNWTKVNERLETLYI
jgi:superoxide dismutase